MKLSPQRVSKALHKSGAILSEAAVLLKVSRPTLHAFMQKHPEMQALRTSIEDDMLDKAQCAIADGVLRGEVDACARYIAIVKSKNHQPKEF
ncbi:hypothetical protein ACSBOB_19605 [Mesorhizobium sp. ASY16-5R]|uniref:hypothetical protein n=1 Tax=Mesorhizobium sp. ASY16-5R TaxID=3445772 RepID=UPI003F9F853F